ncbi:MAG: hypothetical protein H0V26_12685, partial [Solirubrobacterales bacterium]|nr:hypothetical protein [Solirubrobacterales bacterium]
MPVLPGRQDPHDRRGNRRDPADGHRAGAGGVAVRRWLALWLLLAAVYGGTIGIPAFGDSKYSEDEAHHLLTARSIVSDFDADLADQYAERQFAAFYPYELRVSGRATAGRLHEPHGIGFPLLIAPAFAVGGAVAVEGWLAAIAALAFVIAAILARRLVPEPWATGGVVLVALSPPVLAYSAGVYPELAAGALVAFAALCALELRDSMRLRFAYSGALALALAPWLNAEFTIVSLPVAVMLVRWTSRTRRRVATFGVAEIMLASLAVYVTVNERLFGGFTPSAAELPGQAAPGAGFPRELLERLAALGLDRDYGLLRWAPILALGFLAAWLLWRSRREKLARLIPARRDVEGAAGLLLAVCGAQILVAALSTPSVFGAWFPGRHLIAVLPCA